MQIAKSSKHANAHFHCHDHDGGWDNHDKLCSFVIIKVYKIG